MITTSTPISSSEDGSVNVESQPLTECPAGCDRGRWTSRPPNQFSYNCSTCAGTGYVTDVRARIREALIGPFDPDKVLAELKRLGWQVNPGAN